MFEFDIQTATGPVKFGISGDGELVYDEQTADAIDYEIAYAAMSSEVTEIGSALQLFLAHWNDNPVSELHRLQFHRPKGSFSWSSPVFRIKSVEQCLSVRLATDYSERALVELERRHPRFVVIRRALDFAREFIDWQKSQLLLGTWDNVENEKRLLKLFEEHQDNMRKAFHKSRAWSVDDIELFTGARRFFSEWYQPDAARWCSWSAARAISVAKSHTVYEDDPHRVACEQAEQRWQVRRFVDVMTALKADKPWPPLRSTP